MFGFGYERLNETELTWLEKQYDYKPYCPKDKVKLEAFIKKLKGDENMCNRAKDLLPRNYEIVLCPKCKGFGHFDTKEDAGSHKSEYDFYSMICSKCKGSGRILRKIVITEKPYKPLKPNYEKKEKGRTLTNAIRQREMNDLGRPRPLKPPKL